MECKQCQKEMGSYYQRNKERLKEYQNDYYHKTHGSEKPVIEIPCTINDDGLLVVPIGPTVTAWNKRHDYHFTGLPDGLSEMDLRGLIDRGCWRLL